MKNISNVVFQHVRAVFILLLAMLAVPDSAWALQAHGAPEGIYVHQMAHAFFFCSLLYLYRDLGRSASKSKGWNYLKRFCLLMLAWNIVAFTGHMVAVQLAPEHIAHAASYFRSRLIGPMNLTKFLFYITRFDHLLLVPALFFLYMGLRTLFISVENEMLEEGSQ